MCRRYRLVFLGAFNCVWGGIWEATQGGLASILKAELLVWAEANGAVSVRLGCALDFSRGSCALTLRKGFVIQLFPSIEPRIRCGSDSLRPGRIRSYIQGDMKTLKAFVRKSSPVCAESVNPQANSPRFGWLAMSMVLLATAVAPLLTGCGGGGSGITLAISPSATQTLDEGQSVTFYAQLGNDTNNKGVAWQPSR